MLIASLLCFLLLPLLNTCTSVLDELSSLSQASSSRSRAARSSALCVLPFPPYPIWSSAPVPPPGAPPPPLSRGGGWLGSLKQSSLIQRCVRAQDLRRLRRRRSAPCRCPLHPPGRRPPPSLSRGGGRLGSLETEALSRGGALAAFYWRHLHRTRSPQSGASQAKCVPLPPLKVLFRFAFQQGGLAGRRLRQEARQMAALK